jgi:hypothetical protein
VRCLCRTDSLEHEFSNPERLGQIIATERECIETMEPGLRAPGKGAKRRNQEQVDVAWYYLGGHCCPEPLNPRRGGWSLLEFAEQ